MNKKKLIEKIHTKSGFPKSITTKCINEILQIMSITLTKKEDVYINNFGYFKNRECKARTYKVPNIEGTISTPVKRKIYFKASKKLLNNDF